MQLNRLALLLIAIIAILWVGAPSASAHGAGLTALVNVDPEIPLPGGTARISIDLLDAYGADVPFAKVKVGIVADGSGTPRLTALNEVVVGAFTGEIAIPPAGNAVLLIEAELLDGPWLGELGIRLGQGGTKLWQAQVDVIHADALPLSNRWTSAATLAQAPTQASVQPPAQQPTGPSTQPPAQPSTQPPTQLSAQQPTGPSAQPPAQPSAQTPLGPSDGQAPPPAQGAIPNAATALPQQPDPAPLPSHQAPRNPAASLLAYLLPILLLLAVLLAWHLAKRRSKSQ